MVDSGQPPTRMEVLANATDVTVNNSHFSSVGRDQYNLTGCTIIHHHLVRARGKKGITESLPRLEEYNEVKQGSIIKGNDIGEPWLFYSNGEAVEAAVYTAKIISYGSEVFTVKAYKGGQKARKRWRRDFLMCSTDWRRDIPLFGYNKSSVPLLIFHGELIPTAHFEKGLGTLGDLYIELLRMTLGCSRNELWMDPTNGRFCRGPSGPKCKEWGRKFKDVRIPSDVDFLKEGVLRRYFFSTKDDQCLSYVFNFGSRLADIKGVAYPQVVSSLTNSTIAFHRNVRWKNWTGCLDWEGHMSEGMTRFRLKDDQRFIIVESIFEGASWLAQSSSTFHAHGIGLDEDLSDYKLAYPLFKLTGTLQRSKHKRPRRLLSRPIYLFVLPSPSPTGHFYFWSHDRLGCNPLSRDECKHLGLPFTLSIKVEYYRDYWPTEIYKTVHDYQIVKGFDPTTVDFARSQGVVFMFEVVPPENRFQELEEEDIQIQGSTNAPGSLTNAVEPATLTPTQKPVGVMRSFLGALISMFNPSEVEDLGISAIAF